MKTKIRQKDIDQGWEIVRGMMESVMARPTKTARQKVVTYKTIKILIGTLRNPPVLKGKEPKRKAISVEDRAVLADEAKYGSLPKAVAAHCYDGRLSPHITEASHLTRIRAWKRQLKVKKQKQ